VSNLRTAFAVAMAMYALLGGPGSKKAAYGPVELAPPAVEFQSAVSRVRVASRSLSNEDRGWLQGAYANCARVVESDGTSSSPQIKTTAGLQAVHVAVLSFVWNGLAGKEPGKSPELREAIEAAFISTVGDEMATVTPAVRSDAVEVLKAIAWACGG